jgi:hypothetical protein
MMTCESSTYGTSDSACGAPAVASVTFACVHEHICSAAQCAEHLDQILTLNDFYCRLCLEEDGHSCRHHIIANSPLAVMA